MGGTKSSCLCLHDVPTKFHKKWLNCVPDEVLFKDLTIPGTHDSASRHWIGIASTQRWSIADQLEGGIRYFDLRLAAIKDELLLYHGFIDLNLKFKNVLKTFSNFLDENPSEFIFFYCKRENPEKKSKLTTLEIFKKDIAVYESKMLRYEDDQIHIKPLGELRGKIIYMDCFDRKFETFANWNEQNKWTANNYDEVTDKINAIEKHLNLAISSLDSPQIFSHMLSANISRLSLYNPHKIAERTNEIPLKFKGRMGVVAGDYLGEGLIEYLIGQNKKKEGIEEKEGENMKGVEEKVKE